VFYFSVFPYVPRFFQLPLITYFLILFLDNRHKLKTYALGLLATLWAMPAAIIATVFVTLNINLGITAITQGRIKKVLAFFALVGLINAVWLLPFANYTLNKSSIIRLAPTFIDANEIQLNKTAQYHSFVNQSILLPSFFETQITNLTQSRSKYLHPLADTYNKGLNAVVVTMFPVLYLIGSLIVLSNIKRYKRILWVPISIGVFLFLSMKEFSYLGFIFIALNKLTPLFGVLFRFGDTKLHPFIAFSGAIACAVAITTVYRYLISSKVQNSVALAFYVSLMALNFITYNAYFRGQFLGFFMYNKIPQAYFNIAQKINTDADNNRVIHLPYNDTVYWRSYSWGYVGSHFFGYMLNKPLLEKTFEPASVENAQINKKLYALTQNFSLITDLSAKETQARSYYEALRITGTKYIVLDETVSRAVETRNAMFWAEIPTQDTKELLNTLVELNLVTKTMEETVNYAGYVETYNKEFALTAEQAQNLKTKTDQISLYELKDPIKKISFEDKVTLADINDTNLYEHQNFTKNSTYYQTKENGLKTPLNKENWQYESTNTQTINLKEPNTTTQGTRIEINNTSTSKLIGVSAKTDGQNITVNLQQQDLPTINGKEFYQNLGDFIFIMPAEYVEELESTSAYATDWHILDANKITKLRLQIGDTIIPIPQLNTAMQNIGTVLADTNALNISLLAPNNTQQNTLAFEDVQFADNPNCFNDNIKDYKSELEQKSGVITIRGQNGATCFVTKLNNTSGYTEVELTLDSNYKDLDKALLDHPQTGTNSSKPILTNYIDQIEKPSLIHVCLVAKEGCFNKHSLFNTKNNNKLIVTTDINQDVQDYTLLIALRNLGYQQMELNIQDIKTTTYTQTQTQSIELLPTVDSYALNTKQIELELPKTLSKYSFYYNPKMDAFYTPSANCFDSPTKELQNKILNNKWVSYLENCQSLIFETIPYTTKNLYLWGIKYNLASGQFPFMVLKDKDVTYLKERTSLQQGYPDVPGFKEFQNPEFFTTKAAVEDTFNNLQTKFTYKFIKPMESIEDTNNKDYLIEHYSENEGIMIVDGFEVTALPNNWQTITTTPNNNVKTFDLPSSYSFKQITPAIYKVQVEKSAYTSKGYMLHFNEGFDLQWHIYHNFKDVILGRHLERANGKCNGISNCFELNANENLESMYLVYRPALLYILGSIVSITTIVVWGLFSFYKFRQRTLN
ncbi:hypothetical protein KC980_00165, partial [candidate division WWE3 bacterium]|nr:hypothetical protein [candidate division WWE3 bacterium]